jgi:hypothetical protein
MLWPFFADARPVSYAGGTMAMVEHDPDSTALNIDYSPTAHYAVGWRHEYFQDQDAQMDALRLNWLAKRWNNPASQGNFWVLSGAGVAYGNGEINPAAWTGVSIDWEDRRFYTMAETKAFYGGGDNGAADNFIKHKARLGVAPYVGDAGDLHTWLMIQADYDAGKPDDFSVTPLVRMFKGSTLVEAGYNLDGGALLNLTHTF